MTSLWPDRPYTFRALRKTYGQMWLRCDACRRYAALKLRGLLDIDYRTRTFSCSVCGAEASVAVVEPIREQGMEDYRRDERHDPLRHPQAASRLGSARGGGGPAIDHSGGELPGRSLKGRR